MLVRDGDLVRGRRGRHGRGRGRSGRGRRRRGSPRASPSSTPARELLPPEAMQLAGGFGPEVAPQTTTRPTGRTAVSDRAHVASPTVSTTTSTPLPVASLTAATTSPSSWFTATSAPHSRAASSFSSLPEVTIVRTPRARQISNAAVATPPPMPQMSAHSPSVTARARDEHPVRRLVDEREGGALLEGEAVVEREHLGRVDRDQLRVRPVAVLADDRDPVAVVEAGVEHYPLADLEGHAVAERLDDARRRPRRGSAASARTEDPCAPRCRGG